MSVILKKLIYLELKYLTETKITECAVLLITILDIFHMNIDCCTMYGAACWSHCETRQIYGKNYSIILLLHSGGQSTQIKYLSKSTDTYTKILLQ